MSVGQPETRARDLLDKINTLSATDRGNEFLLKSLSREAFEVIGAGEVAFGNMMLGALAAVRQDLTQTRACHEKALNARPYDAEVIMNYAVSLFRLGQLDEAIKLAHRAWDLDKSRGDLLATLLEFTASGGRIRDAAKCIAEAESAPAGLWGNIKEAAALLAAKDISDDAASAIAREAFAVLPHYALQGVENRVAADDETQWVDFSLHVDASLEKIMELNFAFAERLAELTVDAEIGKASSAFVVRFTRNPGTDAGISC